MKQVFFFLKKWALLFVFFIGCSTSLAQVAKNDKNGYALQVHWADKDTAFRPQSVQLQIAFSSRQQAIDYAQQIPLLLQQAGYPAASLDSTWEMPGILHAGIFAGPHYEWVMIIPREIEQEALDAIGLRDGTLLSAPITIQKLKALEQRLLHYYEDAGYPFATVFLDSVAAGEKSITALLKVNKGALYHIDSVSIKGDARISHAFLHRYLVIPPNAVYNKSKLQQVDQRLKELAFVTPVQSSDLTMLGTGSVLNLYLRQRKSSRFDFLLGFLPAAGESKKMQLTGDLLLDLKNVFGGGQSLLVKWQQLQRKSPRLNLGFNQPFIFNSPLGFDFLFELFRKDSSFLQVNAQAGLDYFISPSRSGKIFMQWQMNNLLEGGVDTVKIKQEKKLPPNIDVRSVNIGGQFKWSNTNYRLNPSRGNEFNLTMLAGSKRINTNNEITALRDPTFDYRSLYDSLLTKSYQMRIKAMAAHYFPLKKNAVLKLSINGGLYQSPEIFRNELFQIGGFNLLRGFDEESIYSTRYAVATTEYRYLIGINSYLFSFADMAISRNNYRDVDATNRFLGLGIGILYETKAGLITVCYAAGFRNDVSFSIREASKLHFGYIQYF